MASPQEACSCSVLSADGTVWSCVALVACSMQLELSEQKGAIVSTLLKRVEHFKVYSNDILTVILEILLQLGRADIMKICTLQPCVNRKQTQNAPLPAMAR